MRVILALVVVLLLAIGALCGSSYYAVVSKANASYAELAPVSARISRFKTTGEHTFSIFWKLRFKKPSKQAPSVAVWHIKPFGKVDFEGTKRN
ncbi:MAG: hypothetical protein ACJ8KU_03510 [Chthoniobacterales bacterium]